MRRQPAKLADLSGLAFDAIPVSACVVDGRKRLLLFNEQFLMMHGLSRKDVSPAASLRCVLEGAVERGALTQSSADEFRAAMRLSRAGPGKSQIQLFRRRLVAQFSMIDRDRWLVVYRDASTRRSLEDQLQTQIQFLNHTLANMAHGLCLFGPDERLILRNDQYCRLYGIDPEIVRPGVSHRDIIEHWIACGNQPGMSADEFYERRMREIRTERIKVGRLVRRDGRIIEAVSRITPEGGWVSTNEDITERCQTEARILHMARHDMLTSLPNRMLFRERMAEALEPVAKGAGVMALLLIDLDNFKSVNDQLGHASGDKLLEVLSARFANCVRAGDTAARLGGDEFAVLLPDCEPQAAAKLAGRIIGRIAQPVLLAGQKVRPGASIGIACAPQDGTTEDVLMKHADEALYRSKHAGRDTYRFFDLRMQEMFLPSNARPSMHGLVGRA